MTKILSKHVYRNKNIENVTLDKIIKIIRLLFNWDAKSLQRFEFKKKEIKPNWTSYERRGGKLRGEYCSLCKNPHLGGQHTEHRSKPSEANKVYIQGEEELPANLYSTLWVVDCFEHTTRHKLYSTWRPLLWFLRYSSLVLW